MAESQAPPDQAVQSLVLRIIRRHHDALGVGIEETRGKVVNAAAASGTLRGGGTVKALRDAYIAAMREYAAVVTRETIDVLTSPDGTLPLQSATWLRAQLETNFERVAVAAIATVGTDRGFQGLPVDGRDHGGALAVELKRDLGIVLDKAALRSGDRVHTTSTTSDADLDTLVALKNRRGYEADLAEAWSKASTASVPLALLAFDIDKFKSVNDEHGGHATGDEALVAVAEITSGIVRGKGTAYRLGGDEFTVLLPNHSRNEAIAVAERIRETVNARALTSRKLRLSLSVGVAVFPEHASELAAFKKAGDDAAYDAKNIGRNLVRVFGEPPPTARGPREPERKEPTPGLLTDAQRRAVREEYFTSRTARCPLDKAILTVQDITAFGDKTNTILVLCPLCGLQETIAGGR
jgi:diguanylate cyclase (GGDEF)-like protein